MRIISKFKDFYDSGIALGIDERIVYVRHTEEETYDRREFKINTREKNLCEDLPYILCFSKNKKHRDTRNGNLVKLKVDGALNVGFLHFCGTRYPFVVCKESVYHPDTGYNINYKYYWSLDELKKDFQKTLEGRYRRYSYEEHFKNTKEDEMNARFRSPVILETFTSDKQEIVINPCLKDTGYSKEIDPIQAFQRIFMYVSALQNPEDKDLNPEATDVEKVVQKGMDPVYGFRKRKA
jgi:hypothetical protein